MRDFPNGSWDVAAAVAVKTGRDVAEIDIAAVQTELKRQDVRLW